MPRAMTTMVYKFEELSDDAKEKARDWWREVSSGDDFWYENVISDAAEIARLLGMDLYQRKIKKMDGSTGYAESIYFRGFWSQGDGACFEGTFDAHKLVTPDELAKQVCSEEHDRELHRICRELNRLKAQCPDLNFNATQRDHHYSHEHTIGFDVSFGELAEQWLDGMVYRSPEEQQCKDLLGQIEEDLIEVARDYMRWIYKRLEAEYEWCNADEQVDENIIANEYEFDEEGNRI